MSPKDPKDIVPDVYALLGQLAGDKPIDRSRETDYALDRFLDGVRHVVRSRLFNSRAPRTLADKKLWPSEIGRPCIRQLWYKMRPEIPKEGLQPATIFKFMVGDVLEHLILLFVRLAGHDVKDQQKRLQTDLGNGWTLGGSIDARIDGVITDVKTAATRSFEKFKSGNMGDDLFGYNGQLDAYASMEGDSKAAWLAVDKQHGHLAYAERTTELALTSDLDTRTRRLERDAEPSRPPGDLTMKEAGPNTKLAALCSYCEYKAHCWKDANGGRGLRKFIYSNGPVYLTEVKKAPRVVEVPIEEK